MFSKFNIEKMIFFEIKSNKNSIGVRLKLIEEKNRIICPFVAHF